MNEISRRNLLKSAAAGLPLAAILADPMLASAAAADTETVSIQTPSGHTISGALAIPATLPAPCMLLIHEWWGLNDHIRAMSAEFARDGYIALSCDLYNGKVAEAGDRDMAQSLMKSVDGNQATETVTAWVEWLRRHDNGTGKLGTVGWCFGGGWSLNASLSSPVDATVVYYGRVSKTAEELSSLNGPVLGQFANNDKWINQKMVSDFESAMDSAGKTYTNHWYDADHAFANPTSGRYDQEDAALAWQRTREFLSKHLS